MLIGVVGASLTLEEASQSLRVTLADFPAVTLPLMAPGLANAFLVGFESNPLPISAIRWCSAAISA